jgi:hypothetical protein
MLNTRRRQSGLRTQVIRKSSRHAALLEALESRVLLSGTVTVTVQGHNLLITGDDASNDIVITGSNGAYVIATGTNTTTITNSPVTGITGKVTIRLNGGDDVVTFNGASFGSTQNHTSCSLSIDGGAGDDAVIFTNATCGSIQNHITCPVTINGAAGNNTVTLTGTTIVGSLAITNAAGFDSLSSSGNTLVTGAITINNGLGGSNTSLQSGFVAGSNFSLINGAHTTSCATGIVGAAIAGNLTITNNNAVNTVLTDVRVGGKTTITNATAGVSQSVVVTSSTLGKALQITAKGTCNIQFTGSNINGDVTITADATASATAVVFLATSTISGNVTCSVGAKTSAPLFASTAVTIGGTSLSKNLTLNAAGQTNNLSIASLQLAGAAKLSYGTGYNTASITGSTLAGNVTFASAGTGCDTLTFNGAIGGNLGITSANNATSGDVLTLSTLSVSGNFSAKTFAGADTISATTFLVQGTTNLQTGDGNDTVNLDDCQFVNALSYTGGNGDNQILIEQAGTTTGPVTTFFAGVSLKVGNGNNTVEIGTGADGRKALFLGPLSLVGGTGTNHLVPENLLALQTPSLTHFSIIS